MFDMYDHPGVEYVCRHCGGDAGFDPELCMKCGPVCGDCWAADEYPCDADPYEPVYGIDERIDGYDEEEE